MKTADLISARPGLAAWWARAKSSDIGIQALREQGESMQAFMRSAAK
jgi:glutathione S-transferase